MFLRRRREKIERKGENMSANESKDRRAGDVVANLIEQLHDPVRLRVCVIAAVLAVGYFAVYSPMNGKIVETTKKLERDNKLIRLATKMEQLQKEYDGFKSRIPKDTDSKEWVQYMLDGIRHFPLKLVRLDCREPKKVGPYRAIVMKIELEGSFLDMDEYLRWLESNRRLLRVDEISIAPANSGEHVTVLRLTVLGLTT